MKLFSAIVKLCGIALLVVAVLGYLAGLGGFVLRKRGGPALPLIDGPIASALGVIGIVFFVVGYFLLKRAEKKDPGNVVPQLDINNLGFIEKAIRRTRRRNYIFGICMIVFAALFVAVPFLDPEANPSSGGSVFIFCLAALMMVIGFWMLVKAMQLNNIPDSEIYQAIMLQPKTITRLDAQIIRSAYTKYSTQINANLFIDTKKIAVLNVNESELELLRQYLTRHNPNLQYSANEQHVG